MNVIRLAILIIIALVVLFLIWKATYPLISMLIGKSAEVNFKENMEKAVEKEEHKKENENNE